MPTRPKTPLDVRRVPFDMDELIPTGAVITSMQAFASRYASATAPLGTTELDNPVSIGAGTIDLKAHPGVGALLIVEPGGGAEERLKVLSVSGATAPFTCTVTPIAVFAHADNAAVSYEPGVTPRFIVDETPTPSGVNVTVEVQAGCHAQKYRVSLIATLNNGEIAEDEVDIEVNDLTPSGPNIKQPSERRDAAGDFEKLLEESHQAGATLSSATCYASTMTSTSTTLAASAAAGATTVSLTVHPGLGAKLIIDPSGVPEHVYVSAVSGTGPFTATIQPSVEFPHSNGATVTVFTGTSATMLTSPTSTISDLLAINRVQGGAAGRSYRLVWLATTSQGEKLQRSGHLDVSEI